MESKQNSIRISQEARFFTLGELSPSTPAIWLVCHGYGQLAPYFIRHFQVLAEAGHFVIAPEGLSRFYLQGTSGRVGASWMTKEERQTDIDNYVSYLSAVYDQAVGSHPAPLHLLGFSQGVATVSRWAMLADRPFQELVLWAGVFPPDLPLELTSAKLQQKKVSLVYGTEDPYLTAENLREQEQAFRQLGIEPQVISFTGRHELNPAVLKKYFTAV